MRILQLAQASLWEIALIKVTYYPGFWNEGEYYNYPDLRKAISAFTEANLLKK
jgi:hypothetical protein